MDERRMDDINSHFAALSSLIPLRPIRSDDDYDRAVATLNQLLDAGASDERHPLADLVDTLGSLIAEYDDKHFPLQQVSPIEVLQFLMEQHQLTQSDLPEIGSQAWSPRSCAASAI